MRRIQLSLLVDPENLLEVFLIKRFSDHLLVLYNNYIYRILLKNIGTLTELDLDDTEYLFVNQTPIDLPEDLRVFNTGGTISSAFNIEQLNSGGISIRSRTSRSDSSEATEGLPESLNVFSEDLQEDDYRTILDVVRTRINNPEIRGLLIFHGTDTVSMTSAMIAYAFPDLPFPIFMVSTQRGRDCPFAEEPLYLDSVLRRYREVENSVYIVSRCSEVPDEVGFFAPIDTVKLHSTRLQTFTNIITESPIYIDRKEGFSQVTSSVRVNGSNLTRKQLAQRFPRVNLMYPLTVSYTPQVPSDIHIYIGTGVGNLPSWVLQEHDLTNALVLSNCRYGETFHGIYHKGETRARYGVLSSVEATFAKTVIGFLRTYGSVEQTLDYVTSDIGDRLIGNA